MKNLKLQMIWMPISQQQSKIFFVYIFTEFLAKLIINQIFVYRISAEGHKGPRPRRISEPSGDEEDLALLTPEERERRKSFEVKRKAHYNEFYAVKMARQLMDENDDEDEDENSSKPSGNCPMETENS